MAKKKNQDIGKLSLYAIVLFTVVTIIMAFLTNVKYMLGDKELEAFSGFKIMFGAKEEFLGQQVEVLSFSFMAFLAYLLPIGGLITSILFSKSKLLSIVPLACFIVSAILLFLMPQFVVSNGETVEGGILAVGAIIAGIVNILSAIAVAVKVLLS